MTIPNIPSNLLPTSPQQSGLIQEVKDLVLSQDQLIKRKILEELFPDKLFNVIDPATGTISFENIEVTTTQTMDAFVVKVKIPSVPFLPTISLIPRIPQLNIPSPAEIKAFLMQKILRKKRESQEQLLRTQLADARKEDTPFTARRELLNKGKNRIQNSVLNGK